MCLLSILCKSSCSTYTERLEQRPESVVNLCIRKKKNRAWMSVSWFYLSFTSLTMMHILVQLADSDWIPWPQRLEHPLAALRTWSALPMFSVAVSSSMRPESWRLEFKFQSSPGLLVPPSFRIPLSVPAFVLFMVSTPSKYQSALKAPLALHPHTLTTHMAHTITESPMKADWNFHAPGSAVVLDTARHKWLLQCQKKVPKSPWNDWTNGKSKTIENRFSVVKQNWGIFGSWDHHETVLKRLSKALAPQASKRSHTRAVPIVILLVLQVLCWDVPYIYCCTVSAMSLAKSLGFLLALQALLASHRTAPQHCRFWSPFSSFDRKVIEAVLPDSEASIMHALYVHHSCKRSAWGSGLPCVWDSKCVGVVALSRSQRISRFLSAHSDRPTPTQTRTHSLTRSCKCNIINKLCHSISKDIEGNSSSGLILHDVLLRKWYCMI